MKMQKKNIAAIVLVVFCAAVILLTSIKILTIPTDASSLASGNYSGALINGGTVLDDEGLLFYSTGNGVYRTTPSGGKGEKISETGGKYLQAFGAEYCYLDGDDLIACNFLGENKRTVLSNVRQPHIVGGIVYFLDSENRIMRYSVRYDKYYEVVNTDNPDCRFDVYFNRVYYTAKDGTLHTVRSNGKEDTVMVDGYNITRFMITGQYVFYLDDGYVCSAQRLSDSDKMHIIPIVEADNFTVMDERIVYCVDNKVYYGELNSLANEVKDYEPYLLTEDFSEVMCGEDCFFFFDKDGVLCSVPLEYNGEGPVRY